MDGEQSLTKFYIDKMAQVTEHLKPESFGVVIHVIERANVDEHTKSSKIGQRLQNVTKLEIVSIVHGLLTNENVGFNFWERLQICFLCLFVKTNNVKK